MPLFELLQHFIALFGFGPNRFVLFEANLVETLAQALLVAAEMGRRGDPHHAVERHVLVVDDAENGHGETVPSRLTEFDRIVCVAASTAARNGAGAVARGASASSPASVVPPGLVTWSRSSAGDRPVAAASTPRRRAVCAASSSASSGGSPIAAPPSASASITV